MKNIKITGARTHNLKNISLEIEKEKITVISGISGSGKSSLAFDTIFAEGQRRYVDNLSSYARQVIGVIEKPDVDSIENIPPAISIDQKSVTRSPRSTVGTLTEAYDYLRLIFARFGTPYCPTCGNKISGGDIGSVVEEVVNHIKVNSPANFSFYAPIVRDIRGGHQNIINRFANSKFKVIKIDGEIYLTNELTGFRLDKNENHSIDVLIDEIDVEKFNDSIRERSEKLIKKVLDISNDSVLVAVEEPIYKEVYFSKDPYCRKCNVHFQRMHPRIFSFNSPHGACQRCQGLGVRKEVVPGLVMPNGRLTLEEGAIRPWSRLSGQSSLLMKSLADLSVKEGFKMDVPVEDLGQDVINKIMYGFDNFEGVISNLQKKYRETDSDYMRQEIEQYMQEDICDICNGKRLNQFALSVKFVGKSISEFCDMEVLQLIEFMKAQQEKLEPASRLIFKEILRRLENLKSVGLEYLSLSRSSETLSGGEAQRIRLGAQFDSFLSGVLYVLDEPTISLHSSDTEKLIKAFVKLKSEGNTVLIVEHDEAVLKSADYIIDMGPEAGKNGGYIIAKGTPEEITKDPNSVTGKYISGSNRVFLKKEKRVIKDKIKVTNSNKNNLKNIDVEIPLGLFTCVTGVSGCGKSTLVFDVIASAVSARLNNQSEGEDKGYEKIEGVDKVDKIIKIDQSPIGRTPRSNLATYTGLFTPIRELFALTQEAQLKGFQASRFSFNLKGGRCETCRGDGLIKIEMYFMPDAYVKCDECNGQRYNKETLDIRYRNKTIADILAMTVEEALEFFSDQEEISEKLSVLKKVGLGYLALGQSATTLSGGEAQRIKLSTELSRPSTGETIYILDEPTTGLHFEDVKRLLEILHQLVDKGNTVLVIEHNLDVIRNSDWVIDLGPLGGSKGGEIVALGTPLDVKNNQSSLTGKYI